MPVKAFDSFCLDGSKAIATKEMLGAGKKKAPQPALLTSGPRVLSKKPVVSLK